MLVEKGLKGETIHVPEAAGKVPFSEKRLAVILKCTSMFISFISMLFFHYPHNFSGLGEVKLAVSTKTFSFNGNKLLTQGGKDYRPHWEQRKCLFPN